jgi:DNA-binding NtrC family response regulator
MTLQGKILVVDDHRDLAENLAEILEGAGYEAIVADSAEAALAHLEHEQVVALITDYRLPGRTGAELIKELRHRGNAIPAIVMSAFTDDETIAIARKAGAMDVLPKPVELTRLFSFVSDLSANEGWVLLVEDDANLAENLAEAISSRGHRVEIKGRVRGTEGWSPAPAAAIVDFQLPDGTGIEIADRLTARNPGTRILFVTGHVDALERGLPARLSELERLEKPVDVSRLLDWVAAALRKQKPA